MNMLYAKLVDGREVRASDMLQVIRSNKYSCIRCNRAVYFVSGNSKRCAHFRHVEPPSCVERNNHHLTNSINDAHDRIDNKKSIFHASWQAIFPKTAIEVPIKRENKVEHIADIYIEDVGTLQLGHENIIGDSGMKDLVIEIQHSPIGLYDAMKREEFYRTTDREMLWVFDISFIPHNLERIKTMTRDMARIVFSGVQHSGVPHVMKAWEILGKKPNMILDDGSKTLFFVSEIPKLDEERILVVCVDRADFMNQIGSYVDVKDEWKNNLKNTFVVEEDFSKWISSDQLVDSLFNTFVFETLDTLRVAIHNCNKINVIEGIANWLGQKSNKDPCAFIALQQWVKYCHDRFYKNAMKFGKHKGTSICFLSLSYVQWLLEKGYIHDIELEGRLCELCSMRTDHLKKWFFCNDNHVEGFEAALKLVKNQKVAN